MGINSTEVAYNFGQLGSGFCDSLGAFTPPTGKVIVAITFLGETSLSGLLADTSGYEAADGSTGVAYFGHTLVDANGDGGDASNSTQVFPAGLTIYGRWTSVTLASADSDGGIICYFGN